MTMYQLFEGGHATPLLDQAQLVEAYEVAAGSDRTDLVVQTALGDVLSPEEVDAIRRAYWMSKLGLTEKDIERLRVGLMH